VIVLRPVNRFFPIGLGLQMLRLIQATYEATDGRLGSRLGHLRFLLLRTRGRRSGETRTACLTYVQDGENYAVIGSKGGSDSPPAWFLNLKADPAVEVQVGTRRFQARARVAAGAERDRLWSRANKVWDYAGYQARTEREIPVVVLEPARVRRPGGRPRGRS
jgi:deazaflavin-dependent oxidoreductase (nitroreductase family)